MFGHNRALYILENPDTGMIKVGISFDPKNRATVLRYKHKFRGGRFFHTDLIVFPYKTEKKIHNILYKYSVGKEWFCYPYKKGEWVVNNLFHAAKYNLLDQIIEELTGKYLKKIKLLKKSHYVERKTKEALFWLLNGCGLTNFHRLGRENDET